MSRSTRSSSPSSARWSKTRSRNGGPPWTPSSHCPRSAARSDIPGGWPSASAWRWPSRASRPRASSPGDTCPVPSARRPGRSPFRCCSCCSGTTRGTPATGPGPVRHLRQQGEDVARQSRRAHRHTMVRAGGREPVPGPAPEVRPGRQTGGRRWAVPARKPSSRTGPGPPRWRWPTDAQAAPIAAVPANGGTDRSGQRSATSAATNWAHAARHRPWPPPPAPSPSPPASAPRPAR